MRKLAATPKRHCKFRQFKRACKKRFAFNNFVSEFLIDRRRAGAKLLARFVEKISFKQKA